MGRIKTQLIKRISIQFVKDNREQLKKTFEENKAIVNDKLTVPSKKLRNVITGYVTRIMKTDE